MSQDNTFAEAKVRLSVDASGLEAELGNVQQMIQSWASGLEGIAQSAGFVSDRIINPLKGAVQTFASFDDAMLMTRGILGKVSDEGFNALVEQAKELGRTTSWTAEEVATGMVAIARSTGSLKETSNMISGVMDAARATGTAIDVTADFAVNTMKQFGLSSEDATHVMDVMVKTANSSAQTFEDLGWAMSQCGSISKASGYSLEQTATILGMLANVGIKGTAAGTAVKNMLSRLQKQPKEVESALGVLNINPFNEEGALKPLEEIFADLLAATDGMELGAKNKWFAQLFGMRALPGASGFANAKPEDIEAMTRAVLEANGAAAETAELMDSGIGGSLRMMQSALEGVKIAVAEGVVPVLKNLVDEFTPLLTKVAEFVKAHPQIVTTIGAVGAAFAGLKMATFGISQVLQTVSSGMNAVVGTANLFAKINIAGAAEGLGKALSSLGSAGIISAVVAVSVGVLALANNLFSAKAQAKRLNEELANMTGENNKIRKEDFQKYQALINLERSGEMNDVNLGIAKTALEELTKTYGDLGITIEGNLVVGASAGFEGFKAKVRESYQADLQKQRDALKRQIAATEKEVSDDEYMSMNADNAPARRTAVWISRKLGFSSDWNDVKELKEQDAALAQQQKDADIFFGTALGGTKQEAYEQLAVGAGGGMDAGAIQSAIQSGVQSVKDINVEAPAGPVIEAGADAAATAKATEETAKQTKKNNDYLEIISGNMINLTPAFGQ